MKKILLLRMYLVGCILISSATAEAQLFRRNGLYYSGDKDTKEARVISSDNKTNMIIPDTVEYDGNKYIVTTIGDNALQTNSMSTLVIGKHVRSLGIGSCNGCMNLSSVTWGESVDSIEWGAFQLCYALKSINWPDKVTTIGKNMFAFCPLESFVIPASVSVIGSQAFAYTSIKELYCNGTTPPTLESDTFFGVSISELTIHVPRGCKSIYESSDVWKDFPNIVDDQVSAIINTKAYETNHIHEVYQINGLPGRNISKGIVIVRTKEGNMVTTIVQ